MVANATVSRDVEQFLGHLESLYSDVRRWISEIDPAATFDIRPVELAELATGRYQAPSLEVRRSAGAPIRITPRGRYILDADGYVEIGGDLGREMLVWVAPGAPAVGFRNFTAGEPPDEIRGDPQIPGLPGGWAWVDDGRLTLTHLDRDSFYHQLFPQISQ